MNCPYCRSAIQCPKCSTLHHADCFEQHGKCAVFGCEGKPKKTRHDREQPSLGAFIVCTIFFGAILYVSAWYFVQWDIDRMQKKSDEKYDGIVLSETTSISGGAASMNTFEITGTATLQTYTEQTVPMIHFINPTGKDDNSITIESWETTYDENGNQHTEIKAYCTLEPK